MISPIENYRQLAAQAHEQAAAATLPQVKLRCFRSAEHFEGLVAKLDDVAQAKSRNEAARTQADS